MSPDLYEAALHIKRRVLEVYHDHELWAGAIDDPPNPYYNQTSGGLALATYYSSLSYLYTRDDDGCPDCLPPDDAVPH